MEYSGISRYTIKDSTMDRPDECIIVIDGIEYPIDPDIANLFIMVSMERDFYRSQAKTKLLSKNGNG